MTRKRKKNILIQFEAINRNLLHKFTSINIPFIIVFEIGWRKREIGDDDVDDEATQTVHSSKMWVVKCCNEADTVSSLTWNLMT